MNAAYDVAPELISPQDKFAMPGGIVNDHIVQYQACCHQKPVRKQASMHTDIFNAKFVPTKTDDSLGTGRYVVIDGKKYMALPNTPEEFTHPGMLLDPDFITRITLGRELTDAMALIPVKPRWKDILVADAKLTDDDGKAPEAVKAAISGDEITWEASKSKNVIGYYVYSRTDGKIAAIPADSDSFSHKIGKGNYYIVAVDIAGRESTASNEVGSAEEEKNLTNRMTNQKIKTKIKIKTRIKTKIKTRIKTKIKTKARIRIRTETAINQMTRRRSIG